jgi:hypothetical protein
MSDDIFLGWQLGNPGNFAVPVEEFIDVLTIDWCGQST